MFTDFRRTGALTAVFALAGIVGSGAPVARAQGLSKNDLQTVTRAFRGKLEGNFSTVAPAPLLTLVDDVTGHATVLGKVTGTFTPVIDFNQPSGGDFFVVTKTGSLVAADRDQVNFSMVGTFNSVTLDVHYVFVVTGGTGRFEGASGNGTWEVPPPDVFDPNTGSGSGSEKFEGVITLPKGD
jgi:hypothetical protein